MIPKHYLNEKIVKMGRWGGLLPLDVENWHSVENSKYFKKYFGFYKGTLILCETDQLFVSCYFPVDFIHQVHKYIDNLNKKDYKALEKLLLRFYELRIRAKKDIPKITPKNFCNLSNEQLIKQYLKNRDWAHRITVYDQFGWIAEEYWPPKMENLLTQKYRLKKKSPEYFKALFALTKPAEISTTLSEKRAVLEQAIKVKNKKTTVDKTAKDLVKLYGWMPVFTFGTPWDVGHYKEELEGLVQRKLQDLENEYELLKNYKNIRNREFKEIVGNFKISRKDQQLFIDFGLALDARNEAEYIVSFCGFYILPFYKEIARRLAISVRQLRHLSEKEVVAALRGKLDAAKSIHEKRKFAGWGFDESMKTQIYFSSDESAKLLKYLNAKVKNLQGNIEGQGVCANPGLVQGKARILTSPELNFKVKPGDILIAEATTVDYLPAMKRAAAFVTEVGGLTCHAAVVAREFGVPCVVGLKNATKNFRDGDLVEVDADKGIVRKLKVKEKK